MHARIGILWLVMLGLVGCHVDLEAQAPPGQPALTLAEARVLARRVSPELAGARAAVAAAAGRERQAGAFPNPVLSYSREQTSGGGTTNSQDIALFEQRLEIGGQRGARRTAARLRHQAALDQLAAREAQLDYEVTRAYALTWAADRRAAIIGEAADAFHRARGVSVQRLAAGDVSGYANRRIGLEAARYASLRARAVLERRAARLGLATLLAASVDSILVTEVALADSPTVTRVSISLDALKVIALSQRPDLRAADHEAEAAIQDARLSSREAFPTPALGVGYKGERVAGTGSLNGFVLQVAMPLPLWDRRRGATAAARGESGRRLAEAEGARRRVVREVEETFAGLTALSDELEALRPQLGPEAHFALRAAAVAYTEGEVSLLEWLDAVRAYQEAESSFATLQAEYTIRRAALERAVGAPLSQGS